MGGRGCHGLGGGVESDEVVWAFPNFTDELTCAQEKPELGPLFVGEGSPRDVLSCTLEGRIQAYGESVSASGVAGDEGEARRQAAAAVEGHDRSSERERRSFDGVIGLDHREAKARPVALQREAELRGVRSERGEGRVAPVGVELVAEMEVRRGFRQRVNELDRRELAGEELG